MNNLLIEEAHIRFLPANGEPVELVIDQLLASADSLDGLLTLAFEGAYSGSRLNVDGHAQGCVRQLIDSLVLHPA